MGALKEEELVCAGEEDNLLVGEEFSVDDLLNLEFVENEGEEEAETLLENKGMGVSSSASSTSSTVSFEPPLALPVLISPVLVSARAERTLEIDFF